MRAIERLFAGRQEFDAAWRAHAASMRSFHLLLQSKALAPLLATSLELSKGFDPGFSGVAAVDDLFEELEYLRSQNHSPLRKNCLIGVCASFENLAKVAAAALRCDPSWKTATGPDECLQQVLEDMEFVQRVDDVARRWQGRYCEFLREEFDWLSDLVMEGVGEVFWVRNQIAHNAGRANKNTPLNLLGETICKGQVLQLDVRSLGACLKALHDCVDLMFDRPQFVKAYL